MFMNDEEIFGKKSDKPKKKSKKTVKKSSSADLKKTSKKTTAKETAKSYDVKGTFSLDSDGKVLMKTKNIVKISKGKKDNPKEYTVTFVVKVK